MKVNALDDLKYIHSNRDEKDKTGGGLCVMHRKNDFLVTEKVNTKHSDILHVKCVVEKHSFSFLRVYMSSSDQARNRVIEVEINNILDKIEEEPYIPENLNSFWNTVYRQGENKIYEVWNENTRRIYEQTRERDGGRTAQPVRRRKRESNQLKDKNNTERTFRYSLPV